jgi:hypothetical protein
MQHVGCQIAVRWLCTHCACVSGPITARHAHAIGEQVHPEHERAAIGISNKLLSEHDDSPVAFWRLTCPPSCLLRTVALRVLSGKAASLGVERLWSYARAVLTDNRRSILMQRMMQLLQVKMNGMLLKGEALSHCAKSMSAMIDNEASFESIFDDLQQFEEEEQAGCAEQQSAGDLVRDAEGSVAPEADAEAAMPIVDLFSV